MYFDIKNIQMWTLCSSLHRYYLKNQVIDQVQPDIICHTETWLKPDIHTAEIFPCHLGYQIYREDRTWGKGGGVLLTVTKKFLNEEQSELRAFPFISLILGLVATLYGQKCQSQAQKTFMSPYSTNHMNTTNTQWKNYGHQ